MRHQERAQGPEHGREPGPEQSSAPGPHASPERGREQTPQSGSRAAPGPGRDSGSESGREPGPGSGSESGPEEGPAHDPAHEPEHTRAHDRDRGPGRPRSAAAERAILDAVIALLEAGEPLAGLSIERIARTAKVGKATIYRRWNGKEELFLDVLRDMEPPDPVVSGTAGLADLRLLMESHRTRGLAQRSSVLLHNIFVQMKSHPRLWAEYQDTVVAPRRAVMVAAVRRAVAAGELRDDLDVELMDDLLIGAMLVRTLHRRDAPLPEDLVDRVIDALLQGLAPAPRPTDAPDRSGRK